MKQPTSEDLRVVMQRYFRSRALAFTYTMHVSYCGSPDSMELVAYDPEHDMYHATKISHADASMSTSFGEVYGKAVTALFEVVQEHEKYFLKGY